MPPTLRYFQESMPAFEDGELMSTYGNDMFDGCLGGDLLGVDGAGCQEFVTRYCDTTSQTAS